jgi:hypothetical protein
MPAQSGAAILLAYGTQPSQAQNGDAILLEYAPPAVTGRRLVAETRAPWSTAAALASEITGPMLATATLDVDRAAPWGVTQPRAADTRASWIVSRQADGAGRYPWGARTGRMAHTTESIWVLSRTADDAARLPWGLYEHRRGVRISQPWWVAGHADDHGRTMPWGIGSPRDAGLVAVVAEAIPCGPEYWLPWVRYSRQIETGWGVVVEPGGPPVDENGTIIVPVRGVYIVLNEVSLMRVSDSLMLDCLSLSITLDADSWVCGFNASLPGAALDEVIGSAGSPVELEASVNGITFRLLAERVGRDRSFGKSRIAISGRGRAAVLDAPYAPIMAYASASAITAQQAAEAAITASGLPTGWTLDWQLTDWLLPAGLWAHQGSPISALNRIAEAAGGYIQADPATKVLAVMPRYPVVPWEWAGETPDIEIPPSVAVTEGIAWEDKPAYNAVYVSGAAGGVLGHVKRTGTAGDLVAQMVTDDLITHTDAARQRGTRILSDTGRQARVSLSLPVLAETGIILPGQLVRYVDGATTRLGLARSVAVTAGLPKVRQAVEIETHA